MRTLGRRAAILCAAMALLGGPGALVLAAAAPFVWLEGEQPASINVQIKAEGMGNPQFLSGTNWLKISLEADQSEKEAPAEGVLIAYVFKTPAAGDYEIWTRLGYEFVRSPFDWRLGGGDWTPVSPEELTTDLMELSFWTEIAWLKIGQQRLPQGEHRLVFRLPKTKDKNGKPQRMLFALDAICLHGGTFHPNGKFPPGQDGREAMDLDAAKTVFEFPEKSALTNHTALPLKGLWEVCRHDEQRPGEVASPIRDFPAEPHWRGIPVPGDKNTLRPDLVFAHRLWYRTKVKIPASWQSQSFYLVFPQNNLNTTVFVNGHFCGFDKNPFARVQIDVSRAITPGVNEIWVGLKDAWYGYSANPNKPLKLRKHWNLPLKYLGDGFQDLAYPIWNHAQSGILLTPELVAAGTVYAADVFCQPSVAKQELALEVTLQNGSAQPQSGELICEVVREKSGAVEKVFTAKPFTLAAGTPEAVHLVESWANPKLWWPDDPNLYRLRTVIKLGGQSVDVKETTFGFREWSASGKDFTLNGHPWHGWADCFTAPDKEAWLKFYKDKHQTTVRFWGTSWQGLPPEDALDFFDRQGVAVRRSGLLDGEAIGYFAIENDPDLKQLYGSEIKMDLMQNWRDQIVAQVKGERNHPSVHLWSIENEWLYINCINLYGGLMDKFEAEVQKVSAAVRAADPTRLTMTDGGGANKDNSMPVHGNHYVWADKGITRYPDWAYDANPQGGGRGRWLWDEQRPRFIGEDYFIAGNHPELSYIGGEAAFTGKAGTLPAAGLMARILTEGYRWAGCGAFHFWMGQSDTDGAHYQAFAPRAVFCRQWDWTFGSGQQVRRTFGIFNDSHSAEPMAFTWTLNFENKKFAGETKEYRVAPGRNEKFEVTFTLPKIESRTEGELVLALSVSGQEVFRDVKQVSILNTMKRPAWVKPDSLAVYDPKGALVPYLQERGVSFTLLADLKSLPSSGQVLLIGHDALSEADSTSSQFAAWAASGRAVIVLEQPHPLKYQALPCEMESASNEGRTAFAEDLDHPALRGLKQKDFFTWGPDAVVYRHAYLKPTRGAKSLIQCDDHLRHSALAEVPAGKGVLLLSQLVIGGKIASNAAAQAVLNGLLAYAATYRQEFLPVVAAVGADSRLAKVLDATGLKYTSVSDPLAALSRASVSPANPVDSPKNRRDAAGGTPAQPAEVAGWKPALQGIVVIAATPANLQALASNLDQVNQFIQSGGWMVFNGLTPEGLADYNKIVGVEHLIRPFRREKVTFPAVKNHLTAGLTSGDVALYSSERIFPWQDGNYVAADTFSDVVDYDEVAPFAKFPTDYFYNMVNGMVSADGWKYIFSFELKKGGAPEWDMVFAKEQEFIEWTWIGNAFYHLVTKVELTFDGKDKAVFDTQPNNEPQTFAINPPRQGRVLHAKIADWQRVPNKSDVVGVDNLFFKVKRAPEFYEKVKPLLNVGALMEYPRGPGGFVLCNVRYKETEEVPAHGPKKQAMLATLLRNLKAPFAGRSVIAGANLKYAPIDLSKQANAYRDEKGWFGDARFTFKDLPVGQQTFAGVTYEIYDFPTSPVPTVLMLSDKASKPAKEIRGIPVNRQADALFFLHTMRLNDRMNDDDRRKKKQYETLRYVVTYADGQTETIPVYAEIDIHDFKQQTPLALPGAQLAWTKRYAGTEFGAAAYAKQWNNPRPDVEIKSLDMLPGAQPRGVPALLAVTAATAE